MSEPYATPLPFAEITVDDAMLLRQLRPDEAEVVFDLVDQDREYLRQWLPWVDETKSPDDSREFIAETIDKRVDGSGYGYGIIVNGDIAGHIGLMHVSDDQDPEIGYWVASNLSGQGIITKAAKALMEFGFDELGLSKIVIKADPDNVGSNKVAKKLGYTLIGKEHDSRVSGTANVWSLERP